MGRHAKSRIIFNTDLLATLALQAFQYPTRYLGALREASVAAHLNQAALPNLTTAEQHRLLADLVEIGLFVAAGNGNANAKEANGG